jgi:hypothetical protein
MLGICTAPILALTSLVSGRTLALAGRTINLKLGMQADIMAGWKISAPCQEQWSTIAICRNEFKNCMSKRQTNRPRVKLHFRKLDFFSCRRKSLWSRYLKDSEFLTPFSDESW